ncbi:MAG: methylated-DNA--[protein]-cysteine S-methyltransferase [Acidobacteriia bacterium]|nr:methylated-DNA--[protein]-cysteine S-methyltransferase [Terriglobia bacterium]
METLYYSTWQSPIGPLTLVASDRGLVALEYLPELKRKSKATWLYSDDKLAPYRHELEEYFAGELRQFTVPLDLRGTEFQMRCWSALLKIPYGETRTYAEQARAVGQPKAFRAVGMANHDNPIAIIVPCHRVIASDGKLGGYGGGLPLKQKLLDLERGQGRLGSAPSRQCATAAEAQ